MTIPARATEGTIQTEAFCTTGAAAARMSLLYAGVRYTVALGLVVFDWQLWRGLAPALATMQPPCGNQNRVR